MHSGHREAVELLQQLLGGFRLRREKVTMTWIQNESGMMNLTGNGTETGEVDKYICLGEQLTHANLFKTDLG